MSVQPKTRPEFWAAKIGATRERDTAATLRLTEAGWRQLVVWECALRGPARREFDALMNSCEAFLTGENQSCELGGLWAIPEANP